MSSNKECLEFILGEKMRYQELLNNLIESSKLFFKGKLVGVYLHGSMAMGCFNPDRSDIDIIIIVSDSITDNQKICFLNDVVKLNDISPKKGIELSVVKQEYCKPFVYPTPFELHFSPMHLHHFKTSPNEYVEKMKSVDKDLASHFTIIKKYGITLYGEEIDEVFGVVPKKYYLDSIWYDIESAERDILENPVDVILNLCRCYAYILDDLIISKEKGGKWGLVNLDKKYNQLISCAIDCYQSDKKWG